MINGASLDPRPMYGWRRRGNSRNLKNMSWCLTAEAPSGNPPPAGLRVFLSFRVQLLNRILLTSVE